MSRDDEWSADWGEDWDAAPVAAPWVPDTSDDEPEPVPAPFPRPVREPVEVPDDLSRIGRARYRRGARKAARARQREANDAAVQSWHARVAADATAFGPAALVLALVAVAVIWLWPDSEEPATAAADPTVSVCGGQLATCGLPQTRDPWTGESATTEAPSPVAPSTLPEGELGGDDAAPGVPDFLTGPDGQLVHDFVLGYAVYNPTFPDPVGTWLAPLQNLATGDTLAAAANNAQRLWGFTVQDSVSVIDPVVVEGTQQGDTWTLQVDRRLFPVGGDENSPNVGERVQITVTVVDGKVTAADQIRR